MVWSNSLKVSNSVLIRATDTEQWPDDLIEVVRRDVGEGYPDFCNGGYVSIEQDLSQREPRLLDVPALILGGGLDLIVSQASSRTESCTVNGLSHYRC